MVNSENLTLIPVKFGNQEEQKELGEACFIGRAGIDSSDLSSDIQIERSSSSDIDEEKKQLFADLGPSTSKK